jgi:hypothetical protein
MHLRLAPNLQHFLLDFGELYTLRLTPNFYEIHPSSETEGNQANFEVKKMF